MLHFFYHNKKVKNNLLRTWTWNLMLRRHTLYPIEPVGLLYYINVLSLSPFTKNIIFYFTIHFVHSWHMILIDFIAKMWIWCLQCSEFSSLKFYKITQKGPLTNNSKPQKLVANRRVAEQWTMVQFTNKSWIHIVIVTLQHYRSLRRIILQGP